MRSVCKRGRGEACTAASACEPPHRLGLLPMPCQLHLQKRGGPLSAPCAFPALQAHDEHPPLHQGRAHRDLRLCEWQGCCASEGGPGCVREQGVRLRVRGQAHGCSPQAFVGSAQAFICSLCLPSPCIKYSSASAEMQACPLLHWLALAALAHAGARVLQRPSLMPARCPATAADGSRAAHGAALHRER